MCMNTNTWPNAANESAEKSKQPKLNKQQKLNKLYKKYADDLVERNDSRDLNTKISDLMTVNSLSDIDKEDILKLAQWDDFTEIEESDINLSGIRNELKSLYLRRNIAFQKTRREILKNYDISLEVYERHNIDLFIKHQDIHQLEDILSHPKKLWPFMVAFCESKNIEEFQKKSMKDFLSSVNFSEWLKNNYNKLSSEKKEELMLLYKSCNSHHSWSFPQNFSQYLVWLKETGLLTQKNIIEILSSFSPYISLEDAKKINPNLRDPKKIRELKIKQLSVLEDLHLSALDTDVQDKILDAFKDKDVQIDILDLDLNKYDFEELMGSNYGINLWKDIQQTIIDLEQEWWPQTYHSFITELDKISAVEGWVKFINWSFLSLELLDKTSNKEGDTRQIYLEILSDGSDKPIGSIRFAQRWEGIYSNDIDWNLENTYKDFLDFLKFWKDNWSTTVTKCSVLSQKEFKNKIENWEISEDNQSVDFKWEIEKEMYELNLKNAKIRELEKSNPDFKDLSDAEKKAYILEQEPDFEENIKNEVENYNKNYLLKKINDIDNAWLDYGLEEWTIISFTHKKNEWYIKINSLWNEFITIEHSSWEIENIELESFYRTFKDLDAKRTNKTKDNEEFLKNLDNHKNWDIAKEWSGFFISDKWTLQRKEKKWINEDKEKTETYDYIVWENSFFSDYNLIKIHKISWWKAKISFWKFKTEWEKDDKKSIYSTFSNSENISLGILESLISKGWWIPKSLDKENETPESTDPESVTRNGSFLSRLMKNNSINDYLTAGKMLFDSIESLLKEWTDEQAAKLISDLPLPGDLKTDITTRVEQASKKRMDEFKDRLWGIDSWEATELIESVLKNKDAPESKKEACLMFMVEKYGTLYEKSALHKYKWKFLWYEALGWRIWDDLYNEVKLESEEGEVNFTEHELLIRLLWKQCKWKLKPKRRSKFHKEYKAAMWRGKNDEKEKWQKDASEKRTFEWRTFIAKDELFDGAYLNSMGAMKSVIWKGNSWNIPSLNEVPFMMLASWDAYTYDQDTVDAFKNDVNSTGHPMPWVFFISKPSLIEDFNDTVLEVAKVMSEDDDEFKDFYSDAKTLIHWNKNIDSRDESQKKEKLEQAEKFYKNHGEIVGRVMNMLNTRQTDKLAKYERLIWLLKDTNPIFKKYYSTFNWVVNAEVDFAKDDDTMSDAYYSDQAGTGGLSWMDSKKVFTDMLKSQSGSSEYRMQKSWSMIENEFINQLEAFKNIDYDFSFLSEEEANDKKINILSDYIHWYLTAMVTHHRTSGWYKHIFNSFKPLKLLWAKYEDFWELVASDFKNDEPEAIAIANKYAKAYLWKSSSTDADFKIPKAVNTFKDDTNNIF